MQNSAYAYVRYTSATLNYFVYICYYTSYVDQYMHMCAMAKFQAEMDILIQNYFAELHYKVLLIRMKFHILLQYNRVT